MKHHQRHTIPEDEDQHHHSAYFHHNAKLHLRHVISKHQHHLDQRKKQKAQAKLDKNNGMPKNVSFANMAEPVVQGWCIKRIGLSFKLDWFETLQKT